MQGTVLEFVMLSLLILFFGVEQRSRPELFYRFWFAGWICVFLSYVVWEIPTQDDHVFEQLQNIVRYQFNIFGLVLFAFSPTATRVRLRRTMWMVVGLFLCSSLVVDLSMLTSSASRWVLAAAIVASEGAVVWAVAALTPPRWVWRRWIMASLAFGMGFLLLRLTLLGRYGSIPDTLEAQITFAAAFMYAAVHARRSLFSLVGSLAFILWGAFYLLSDILQTHPAALQVVYALWSIPKYLVGVSMILQIFESARSDTNKLAAQYRLLYEDFRLMFEGHPHPMWIYKPETKHVLTANSAALLTYGYSSAELRGMTVDDLEAPLDGVKPDEERLARRWSDTERRYRTKDGSLVWVDINESPVLFKGHQALLLVARDMTRQRLETDALFYRANHDVLTGLPNRSLLRDRIEQCLLRSSRDDRKAALFTIDVDHFKQVNDTYGHPVGDECLKIVASRLKSRIRQVDTLARSGGEEFTAIVGGLHTRADAATIGHLLLDVFREPVSLPDCDLTVTVSIGIAVYPDDAEEIDSLQRLSDTALYAAKAAGRNCVRLGTRDAEIALLR